MKKAFGNSILNISIVDRLDTNPVISRDPEIIYVMEGVLTVFVGATEWILSESNYLVINSEEEHQYVIQETGLFALIRMKYADVADYLELRTHDIQCHSMQENSTRQERSGRLLQSLIGYYLSEDTADEAKLFAESYNLLHQIKSSCMIRKETTFGRSCDDTDKRQEMIRQYIKENYNHKVTLADIANATYLSTTYLSRYIKEKFGKTFSEVLTDMRLEHAEKDIVETNWSITRIALENGFPLPAAFNKTFRQHYGMSPSAYRREHQNDGEAPDITVKQISEPEENLDQKIQDYIIRARQNSRAFGSNIAELDAHVKEAKEFHRFFESVINGGSFRDLMRAEMQEHLLQLRDGLHFTHVRIWDLYAPELMLFQGDGTGRLNFSRIDGVLDFLNKQKIRPYIELGAKPIILLRNVKDYLLYEERKPNFSTPDQYGVFVKQFVTHCVNRYGIEEVEQWYFELWMDPRTKDANSYLNLFDEVFSAIKGISPHIHVGGPGISEESLVRLPELLAGWNRRVFKPDYISIYSYPYLSAEEHNDQSPQGTERVQGSLYVKRLLQETRHLLREYGFWKQELHLSEWNFSVSNRNFMNDSVFKGAYIVKNMLDMIGNVDMAGYWYGTDLYSEFYDSEHLLNGSGGLITKNRICKPAYYGMHFFSRLDRNLLTYNEDGIMATNGRGNYTILCHNYKHPSYQYYLEKEGSIEAQRCDEFFDSDIKQYRFVIRGVENGVYQIKTRVVDEENGSVLNEWARMGYTDELTANDIDYLRNICVPRIKVDVMTVEDGVLEISGQLNPNAISFIHIYHLLKN